MRIPARTRPFFLFPAVLAALCALSALTGCTKMADSSDDSSLSAFSVKAESALATHTSEEEKPGTDGFPEPAKEASLRVGEAMMATADYFRAIESLQELAKATGDDRIASLAKDLYGSFYANQDNYVRTMLMASPLPAAVAGESEEELRAQALKLEADLNDANAKLVALLGESERSYPWPRTLKSPGDAVQAVDAYSEWLLGQLPHLKMNPMMEVASTTGIKAQYEKLRPSLVSLTDGLARAANLEQSIAAVKRGFQQFGMDLNGKQATRIRQAEQLSSLLKRMRTKQDALTVLVTVWRMSAPAERRSIREISPKLYDFLRTKDQDQLSCLAKRRCEMPDLGIAKLFLFKEIERFGLAKLRAKIDASVRDSLKSAVQAEIVAMLPKIPSIVREKMGEASRHYYTLIASVKKDAAGFARSHFERWAKSKFRAPLRGLETSSVHVTVGGLGRISVRPALPAGGTVSSGAETLGASLVLAQQFLPEEDGAALEAALLSPVIKLLGIGGFRQAGGKPYPSFLLPLDGAPDALFDRRELVTAPVAFAVPDAFVSTDSLLMDRKSAIRAASAGAQAELLRGVARQVRFHRDWEQNIFDTSLGRYQLGELLPEAPGAIERPFFAKDLMFSLALLNSAAILRNVTRDLSPAVLLSGEGNALTGGRLYEELEANDTAAVGMVSIENGQRGDTVLTRDVARYALALDELLGATEELEASQASLLQSKMEDGRSTLLEELLKERRKLVLLQKGLANFLARVAQQGDGTFHGAFRVRAGEKAGKESASLRLEDQLLAIRALLVSSERLEQPALRKSAVAGFRRLMSKAFHDSATGFLAAELDGGGGVARAAGLSEIALALRTGQELSSFLGSEFSGQWERYAAPWVKALQEL